MNVAVLNCGSSSVKFLFLQSDPENELASGRVERIGAGAEAVFSWQAGGESKSCQAGVGDHGEAVGLVVNFLASLGRQEGPGIHAVGHRVVHGGGKFYQPTIIDETTFKILEQLQGLAPLHNPPSLKGIKAVRDFLPGVPQVAVFDTAFHHHMPPEAYLYAIPYDLYTSYGIRRYGFHGISHHYVSLRVAGLLGEPLERLRLVSCHLGNGASMAAVRGGRSIDTTMGFTPLEGLPMGSRSGDLDPALVIHLARELGITLDDVGRLLNEESGILGISGVSSDFRDVEAAAAKGILRAELALQVFCYRARRYIGSYVAAMNGLDALIFTGGVGENSPGIRRGICTNLDFFGINVDKDRNATLGGEGDISSQGSRVKVFVIPTREELLIARETAKMLQFLDRNKYGRYNGQGYNRG